jgi:hypothetical protein
MEKISEADFSRLELAGGVPLETQLRERIEESVARAVAAVTWSKAKQIARRKRADEIVQLSANLNAKMTEELAPGKSPTQRQRRAAEDGSNILNEIGGAWMHEAIRTPRSNREVKRLALDQLLHEIAKIYRDGGGKVTVGGGDFSKFLECFWYILPTSVRSASPEALIRRARKLVASLKDYASRG